MKTRMNMLLLKASSSVYCCWLGSRAAACWLPGSWRCISQGSDLLSLNSIRLVACLDGRPVMQIQGCWWLCSRCWFLSHSALSQGPSKGSAASVLWGRQHYDELQRSPPQSHVMVLNVCSPSTSENFSSKDCFLSSLVFPYGPELNGAAYLIPPISVARFYAAAVFSPEVVAFLRPLRSVSQRGSGNLQMIVHTF